MIKTAVVILNWNGEAMLRQFLPSVIACSCLEGTEIYVADNASTDASCEVVEKEFPSVRLIRLDKNYGFADGYNYALQKIDAEYAVLLNSDVEVTEGWLQPMVDYLDTHPETVACQPKIRAYRHRNLFEYAGASGGFIDRYGYPFCRGRVFESVEEDKGQYDEVIPVFWATGAALMIRLDVYRNVGGLDGRFFAHMEEIDLCWRLRSRGYQLVCIPSSTVYHVGGATLKKENPRKTFLNFRNNLLMLYKNLPEEELKPGRRIEACDACPYFSGLLCRCSLGFERRFCQCQSRVECPSGVLPDSKPVYCRPSTKPGPYSIEDYSRTLFFQSGVAGKSKGPKNLFSPFTLKFLEFLIQTLYRKAHDIEIGAFQSGNSHKANPFLYSVCSRFVQWPEFLYIEFNFILCQYVECDLSSCRKRSLQATGHQTYSGNYLVRLAGKFP